MLRDHLKSTFARKEKGFLKSEQKQTVEQEQTYEQESFYPSWSHWSHFGKNVSMISQVHRIKVVDSSKLTAAKYLIYLFI